MNKTYEEVVQLQQQLSVLKGQYTQHQTIANEKYKQLEAIFKKYNVTSMQELVDLNNKYKLLYNEEYARLSQIITDISPKIQELNMLR